MNFIRNARGALAGISPHQSDKHIRRLQSAYVVELFKHERDKDSTQVNNEAWRYLGVKRK